MAASPACGLLLEPMRPVCKLISTSGPGQIGAVPEDLLPECLTCDMLTAHLLTVPLPPVRTALAIFMRRSLFICTRQQHPVQHQVAGGSSQIDMAACSGHLVGRASAQGPPEKKGSHQPRKFAKSRLRSDLTP